MDCDIVATITVGSIVIMTCILVSSLLVAAVMIRSAIGIVVNDVVVIVIVVVFIFVVVVNLYVNDAYLLNSPTLTLTNPFPSPTNSISPSHWYTTQSLWPDWQSRHFSITKAVTFNEVIE